MRTLVIHAMPNYVPLMASFALHASLILPLFIDDTILRKPYAVPTQNNKAQVHVRVKASDVKTRQTLVSSPSGRTKVTKKIQQASPEKAQASSAATPTIKSDVPNVGDLDGTKTATIKERYIFGLRYLVERKKVYPALSRRMGEAGRVLIALQITRDGSIEKVEVKSGSPFERLDAAALTTVTSVKKYDPLPEEIEGERISVLVPIEYSLN